jgi:hypothetical protein
LEDRQLKPLAIAIHGLEDTAPALLVGDVIGDDEQAFLTHRGNLSAAGNAAILILIFCTVI